MEIDSWQKFLLWASFIFFLGALLLRQETAINQDLGRHLRLGEMVIAGGDERKCALFTNCLTYTYPKYPFVNHHWGTEVIFYSIYKLGGFTGLILFKALVLGAAFGITAMHAKLFKGPALPTARQGLIRLAIAIILVFFSVQMMADRLTTRPEIFGYLLFSLLFWLLNKSYIDNQRSLLIYITPVIMLVWVNLHISFIFGLILIWLWTISRILKGPALLASPAGGPRQGRALLISIISTISALANPAGVRGAVMPLAIMKDYGYTIVENMTPFFLRAFKPQPEYWIYASILVITTIMIITSNKRPSVFSILSFYIFSIFPLIAVRHLAFFAIMAPAVLTPLIIEALKGPAFWRKAGPYQISILATGGLFLMGFTNPVPLAYAKLPPVSLAADPRHDEAVKFVKQNHLRGKMWNNYDIGSYLEWTLPQYPTFVDGRPEAFPAGFFRQTYIPMQESREKWDEIVQIYDIRWAFAALTDATPWFQKWRLMIQGHEGWKPVYIDKTTAVYVKL